MEFSKMSKAYEIYNCVACGNPIGSKGMWRHVQFCKKWDESLYGARKTFTLAKVHKTGLYAENLEYGIGYVICEICKDHVGSVVNHVKARHGVTKAQYIFQYPNSLLVSSASEVLRKQTLITHYGVPHVPHNNDYRPTEETKAKIAATNLQRYGFKAPAGSKVIQEKIKATNMERYGVPYPGHLDSPFRGKMLESIRNVSTEEKKERSLKSQETSLKKWGARYYMQSDVGKLLFKESLFKRYGVTSTLAIPGVAEKIQKTWDRNRLNPEKMASILEKRQQTCLERFGVSNVFKLDRVKAKAKEAKIQKYGVSHVLFSEEVQQKRRATCLERYGVDHPLKSASARDKNKQTCLSRYGVEYPLASEEIRNKCKETFLKKYGFETPLKFWAVREKAAKNSQSPNKLETYTGKLFPPNVIFTGNSLFWVEVGIKSHNPDFIVLSDEQLNLYHTHGKTALLQPNAVVEVLGKYFHSEKFTGMSKTAHEEDLKAFYASQGLPCLILWETQIRKELAFTKAAIEKFLKEVLCP